MSQDAKVVKEKLNAALEEVKSHFEIEFKGANYLLVAHAAGLIACVTVLKDYNTTPQLKGMGAFVALFAGGFLFAIAYFVAISFDRSKVIGVMVFDRPEYDPRLGLYAKYGAALVSTLALIFAVMMIAVRLGSL